MFFELSLVRRGVISPMQFLDALEQELYRRIPLGRLALQHKQLTVRQVFQVLQTQVDQEKPFGRIAVELGFLTQDDLGRLLLEQSDRSPHLGQMLIDAGAIDEATLDRERHEFYSDIADQREASILHVVVS